MLPWLTGWKTSVPFRMLQNLPSYNAVSFVTCQQCLPIVFVSLLYIFYTNYSEKKKNSPPPSQEVQRIFEPNKYIQRESNGALLLLKRTDMVVSRKPYPRSPLPTIKGIGPLEVVMKSTRTKTSWWFQAIWKICYSTWIISSARDENQDTWNHHLRVATYKWDILGL